MKSIWPAFVALLLIVVSAQARAQLSVDYYKKSCPRLESIVKNVVIQKFNQAKVAAPGTLRLFFHDCMVEGCDASVLVGTTNPNDKAERDNDLNLSLPGDAFDTIARAKAGVEKICPGVVSCADLLALATRDMVGLIGGPFWQVKKGRKDGLISKASRVDGNLPLPSMNVDQLSALFAKKGFTQKDMVTLSGAHTVGFAHCEKFSDRIYNFQNTGKADPSMDPAYVASLKQACPNVNLDPTVVVFLDPTTTTKFDNVYYANLKQKKGTLKSDQVLFDDLRTRGLVSNYSSNNAQFFSAFASMMDKLGSVGVKTGRQGNIRKNCFAFN